MKIKIKNKPMMKSKTNFKSKKLSQNSTKILLNIKIKKKMSSNKEFRIFQNKLKNQNKTNKILKPRFKMFQNSKLCQISEMDKLIFLLWKKLKIQGNNLITILGLLKIKKQ